MKHIVPDYYKDFKCIAGKCRHSCCIGWEIDIDADSIKYYTSVQGEFGERLRRGIELGSEPHFVLTENERCPFLNTDGLCDIIINLGEDRLCQICSDHPRFRNFFSDRTETGLGLCCEAAAELILGRKEKAKLVLLRQGGKDEQPDSEEEQFYSFRDRVFDIIQNRAKPIEERIEDALVLCGISLPDKTWAEWIDIYLGMERLDEEWTNILTGLGAAYETDAYNSEEWQTAFEQLIIYFLYRNMGEGIYDGLLGERILFAVLSYRMIRFICTQRHEDLSGFIDISRRYSSEIEYCEDNINKILEILKHCD